MKKNLLFLCMLICSMSIIVACKDDDGPEPEKAAPIVEWPSNPSFDTLEIAPDMAGKALIVVKSDAGIKDFKLNISSDVLTEETLGAIGLPTDMDLINDTEVTTILGTFHIPVGDQLKGAKNVNFDISSLVPMILTLKPTHSGNHVFTLNITDVNMKTTTKAIVFHNTVPASFEVVNMDLWANTAVVSVTNLPAGAKVQYRLKGETEWLDVKEQGEDKYLIEASWSETTNESNLTIYNVDPKTGVFAGQTYELRAVVGEEEVSTGSFATAAGDVIPNGDMSNWTEKKMSSLGNDKQVPFPNVAGDTIWDSGNNAFATLCMQDTVETGTAALRTSMVFGAVFAPGNMFTGTFEQPGFTGNANFGAPYAYTARPTGLKLRYKAKVGICDNGGEYDPKKDEYLDKKIDEARVFVAITDWTTRHTVTSGLTDPTSTIWDPATQISTGEGNILAYGSAYIKESSDGWVELTLPINWYVKAAEKPVNNFSLVISCATSARGDYLTGCSTNELNVDDFQWIYE